MRTIILLLVFTFVLTVEAQQSDFKTIDFWRADYIAAQYKGEDLHNLPGLAFNLTSQLSTDVEKFRAIYYWICHNIGGDYYLMAENDRMRNKLKADPTSLNEWNRKFKREVFRILLEDKRTLCTGYAYLLKELSQLAGLECVIVYGYGPTNTMKLNRGDAPNHSWNAVKLNGKWYLCDPTWSSGVIDMTVLLFEPLYEDSYFLMDPEQFAESHQPIDKHWELLPNHRN